MVDHYPDGYLENWNYSDESSLSDITGSSLLSLDSSLFSTDFGSSVLSLLPNTSVTEAELEYVPLSIVLTTEFNIIINKQSDYLVHFNKGILEGTGCSVNNNGTHISFSEEGSFRFELCGDAIPYSSTKIKVQYYSEDFTTEVFPFCEVKVPQHNGRLICSGLATILPIKKGQVITIKLIPEPDDSIVIMAGTRLLIHRVA